MDDALLPRAGPFWRDRDGTVYPYSITVEGLSLNLTAKDRAEADALAAIMARRFPDRSVYMYYGYAHVTTITGGEAQ